MATACQQGGTPESQSRHFLAKPQMEAGNRRKFQGAGL
jgi:hypothetical protein